MSSGLILLIGDLNRNARNWKTFETSITTLISRLAGMNQLCKGGASPRLVGFMGLDVRVLLPFLKK